MHFLEAAVAIVAMSLSYKLLSEFISARRAIRCKRYESQGRTYHHQHTKFEHEEPVQEDPNVLAKRAEELKRRLATLEEIITSERRATS